MESTDTWIQTGEGHEPKPGPSNRLEYTEFASRSGPTRKNAAVDRTYNFKVDEEYHGQRLRDVRQDLHDLF